MAHQIESMFYNSQNSAPWHNLGTPLSGLATTAEAIKAAELDWTVSMQPVKTESGISIPDKFAVVRDSDNAVFTVMGKNYQPLQNKEAFNWFDEVLGEGDAFMETAGSLNGGKMVWLLAQLPDHIRIEGTDDIIVKFLLLANSHDGSKPLTAKLTPIRVVCNNTLSFALSQKDSAEVKIRHTNSLQIRLGEAHRVLGITNKIYDQLDDIFNGMAKKSLNTENMEQYFLNVFAKGEKKEEISTRKSNLVIDAMGLLETGAGMNDPSIMKRGTVHHAYQAITEYVDHHRKLKEGTDVLHANWFGSGEAIKKNAFKEAVALLN